MPPRRVEPGLQEPDWRVSASAIIRTAVHDVGLAIDTLINRVTDEQLRAELRAAVADLRKTTDFGLVFEAHLPETVRLTHHAIRRGIKVAFRDNADQSIYRVVRVDGATATIQRMRNSDGTAFSPQERAETGSETANVAELVALAEVGDPVYPGLRHLGRVSRGGDKAAHVVINGENHHALEALKFSHAGKIDCIYIDPPYNTGARDWKYNNRYVDQNDQFRHSKWLSMMERRLRLVRRLLKADGVLVVTIDANELHHLGLLLEDIFPDAQRQMVTICINPSGTSGEGLSRVDEYAIFCFFGGAEPVATSDDMLTPEASTGDADRPSTVNIGWESLLRRGNAWYRRMRRNLCYPILIDPERQRIVGTGDPLPDDVDDDARTLTSGNYELAWPVRTDGRLGIWRVDSTRLKLLAEQGLAYPSSKDEGRGTWTIRYLMSGTVSAIAHGDVQVVGRGPRGEVLLRSDASRRTTAKTMWHRGRHTAGGGGGTQMLTALLGRRGAFPYPKSVYAVRDCLEVAVGDRKDATVLDFFAGSGTTLHATCLMNAADGGSRRCILVTNNEVDSDTAEGLARSRHYPGDPEFDRHGIFESVTRQRITAAITGRTPDDQPVPGSYTFTDEFPMAEGFSENVEFFELTYLDAAAVDARLAFAGIAPLLWLRAGATGAVIQECARRDGAPKPFEWTTQYGVLFDTDAWRPFVASRPDTVTTAFIVTNSYTEFSHIAGELPGHLDVVRLYERYLATFAVYGR